MGKTLGVIRLVRSFLFAGIFFIAASIFVLAQREAVLYVFGHNEDLPQSGLTPDGKGNLYGTTSGGGTLDSVYEMSPPTPPHTQWTQTVIYKFPFNGNGLDPTGNLIIDGAGNLYGATSYGGDSSCQNGCGIIYELSAGTWDETILYLFSGNDGEYPQGGLVLDAAGNLYGTTSAGGMYGSGTTFELSPPSAPGLPWTYTPIFSFNGADGAEPVGSLVFDSAGNLYGTTDVGGRQGKGVLFELSPVGGGL